LANCDTISVKRGASYLKLIELDLGGTTGEVEEQKFILNYIFMSKEQFKEKLELLKSSLDERFNSLTKYSELEVESWLLSYVNKSEYIEDTLHQLSIDFQDLENSLFDIRARQEITVAPMRDCIENWIKNALMKITEIDQ